MAREVRTVSPPSNANVEESKATTAAPLCVDLDGTLVKTNTLLECVIELVRRRPLLLLVLPFWLMRGHAYLWGRVAPQSRLNVALLPYRAEVLGFMRGQAAEGRSILLVTGAHASIAAKVAGHLGGFDGFVASSGDRRLVGARKADVLAGKFGVGGFDYLGNSLKDLAVWRRARQAILAGASQRLIRRVRRTAGNTSVLAPLPSRWKCWIRALRLHQWVKNLLVFVPLVLAHKVAHADLIVCAAVSFLALCAAGSATYVFNDLLDLEADRLHDTKRFRPFAAGDLTLEAGLIAAPVLAIASVAMALLAGASVALLVGAYLLLTCLYSAWLKRVLAVDVILLAALYCLRLLVGGRATAIPLSPWTIAFSMFLFLSLALMKRYSELRNVKARAGDQAAGRGYRVDDMQAVSSLGAASGMTSVLVIALYANATETQVLYRHPHVLWLVCVFVMLWITRLWLLAGRGELDEDPVVFAVKDPWSLASGVLCGLVMLLAI